MKADKNHFLQRHQQGAATANFLQLLGALSIIAGAILGFITFQTNADVRGVALLLAIVPALTAIVVGFVLAGLGDLIQFVESILREVKKNHPMANHLEVLEVTNNILTELRKHNKTA